MPASVLISRDIKTRKVVGNPNRTVSIERQNEIKFAEYVKKIPHKICEKKARIFIPVYYSPSDLILPSMRAAKEALPNFSKKACPFFGDAYGYEFEVTIGKERLFDDGVYQEFYRYFQSTLRKINNLNLETAFVEWLIKYLNFKQVSGSFNETLKQEVNFLRNCEAIKPNRKTSPEIIEADRLHKNGKSWREIARMSLSSKNPNFPQTTPTSRFEKAKYDDELTKERNRISNAVSKYRKKQREKRVWEKLNSHMENLFGFLRVNEKSFLINPRDN